jgi:murein DD-endopeptidase MepM/ murein hydrolase activator NlpD
MIPFFKYLIEVSACVTGFYMVYYLFLKGLTFFTINRVYLILSLAFSFFIPLLQFPSAYSPFSKIEVLPAAALAPLEQFYRSTQVSDASIPGHGVLIALYLAGVGYMTFRMLRSIISLRIRIANSPSTTVQNIKLVRSQDTQPFTFFNTIVVSPEKISPMVFEHEKTHVMEYHWIDLVFVELCFIILWFNPVMIFVRRSIKQQHEFLADNNVLRGGAAIQEYLHCIIAQLESVRQPLSSNFNSQSIIKRIHMMSKNRSRKFALIMYVAVIPVVALLIMAFSKKEIRSNNVIQVVVHQGDLPKFTFPVNMNAVSETFPFGERVNPATEKIQLHTGMDFAAPDGEPVLSPVDGVVDIAHIDRERGNFVAIRRDDKFTLTFSHLKSYNVKPGDNVRKGQIIGYVGSSGLSLKPHLHFEILINDVAVDPKPFLY